MTLQCCGNHSQTFHCWTNSTSSFEAMGLSWILSSIASTIYFILFVVVSNGKIHDFLPSFNDGLLFGFCVWSTPETPSEEQGCHHQMQNSHMYAFGVDVIFTLAVGYLFMKETSKKQFWLFYLAIAFIILAHGALHFFIFQVINCYAEIGSNMQMIGYIFFAVFTFVLCIIILWFAFPESKMMVLMSSLLCTAVTVTLTLHTGSEWILSALFAVSHPVSCIAGLLSKEPIFSQHLGWGFLVATVVGILELVTCPVFYRAVGGHVWYDVALHSTVLLSLPPFFSKEAKARYVSSSTDEDAKAKVY